MCLNLYVFNNSAMLHKLLLQKYIILTYDNTPNKANKQTHLPKYVVVKQSFFFMYM